jgi:biotin carboxyl carrier protein
MKLTIAINGREETLELLAPAPACRFQLGGAPPREAHVETPARGVYSVLLDGKSYDVFVEENTSGLIVSIDGHRFETEARDPRRYSRKSGAATSEGVQTLSSPMPGKVVRILVAAGDAVEAGQGVLVVEAMKMQNELKAARAGTVLTITAKEGATVVAGAPLATIG